jgi:hypothetical protein
MAAQTLPLRSRAADRARADIPDDRLSPRLAQLVARQKRSPRGLALLMALAPPPFCKSASKLVTRPFKKSPR